MLPNSSLIAFMANFFTDSLFCGKQRLEGCPIFNHRTASVPKLFMSSKETKFWNIEKGYTMRGAIDSG